jgi:hypothetical protein
MGKPARAKERAALESIPRRNSPGRRSEDCTFCSTCGPHFCSMKITEEQAIEEGLKQKATEFTKSGSEIYAKA